MSARLEKIVYATYKINMDTMEIFEIDEQFTKFLGYTKEDVERDHLTLMDLIFEEDSKSYFPMVQQSLDTAGEAFIAHYLKKKDGAGMFVCCFGKIAQDQKYGFPYSQIMFGEMTALYETAMLSMENRLILSNVLDSLMGGVGVFRVEGTCFIAEYLSEGFFDIVGTNKEIFMKTSGDFSRFIYGEDILKLHEDVDNCIVKGVHTIGEYRFIKPDSGFQWMKVHFSYFDREDGVPRICAYFADVTDTKQEQIRLRNMNKELSFKSEIDSLTGVYNHNAFVEHASQSLARQKPGDFCSLLMIDVDDFKLVNDILGHYEGDRVLKETARHLNDLSMNLGFAGRMGGDEFAVFLNRIKSREEAVLFAGDITRKLSEIKIKTGYSVSIGIYVSEQGAAEHFQDYYVKADRALYAAKRAGKNGYILYDEIQTQEAQNTEEAQDVVYFSETSQVLDDLSDAVYVCDADTYELMFINRTVREIYGLEADDKSYLGQKCYKFLHDREDPCEFCTKDGICKGKNYTFLYRHDSTARQYVCRERLVRWKNRKARLETCTDITKPEDVLTAFTARIEMEDAFRNCLLELSSTTNYEKTCRKVLSVIGEYYNADRVVFRVDVPDQPEKYYEWYGSRIEALLDDQYQLKERYRDGIWCDQELKQHPMIIDNSEQFKNSDPEKYEKLSQTKVWSYYSVPFEHEDMKGFMMVCNPKKHTAELTIIELFALFLGNEMVKWELLRIRQYEAYHDQLTGTMNRAAYIADMPKVQESDSLGYVLVDVDNLKAVNAQFGFEYGNLVVKEIADIIKQNFPAYKVYRFDGDDFAVCCQNIGQEEFLNQVTELRKELSEHIVGASVGYVWDDYEKDLRLMNMHAEEMLKNDKKRRKTEDIKKGNQNSLDYMKYNAEQWIENDNFLVYLQPKVDLESNDLCGAEALVRLNHPEKGIVTPNNFIPQMEKLGVISDVDLWVLERVCQILQKWKKEGRKMFPISFNFSRITLLEENLVEKMEHIISKYDIDRNYLEIEITETIGDMEHEMISRIAEQLHMNNFRLSMDDFGTKYSSISVLSLMRFDEVKIDRSMVWNLEQNEISRKIVKHVIAMCSDIGIQCIAEGVENEKQRELLRQFNCDKAQGYLYSKPVALCDFEHIVDNYNS